MKKYWLLKSEPSAYSIDDLAKDKRADWTGIRNYQARNFIRDEMNAGDLALIYHSGSDIGVYGVAKILGKAHGDPTALDKKDSHYDPKSTKEEPIWYSVDILFEKKFKHPVGLGQIKIDPQLLGIMVAARGSRLSVQPLSEAHFRHILELGK